MISIENMGLPEFDIVTATPVFIPFKKKSGRFGLEFKIPSVENYFEFESRYLKLIAIYFLKLKDVEFLEYKEFADMKLIEKMMSEVHKVIQIEQFKKDLLFIINKYFTAEGFNIKKLYKIINPMQLTYLFLFIHKVVETVKKKFMFLLQETTNQVSELFSTSLNQNSLKIVPRY